MVDYAGFEDVADMQGSFNTANTQALDSYGQHAGMSAVIDAQAAEVKTAMAPISSGSNKPVIDPKTGGPVGGGIQRG